MNLNKITNALKKAIENTNKVTQENEGKTYEKPSETYDASIFTGSKEDWEKQDNKLFNSLEEQGYNREDLHTLFDTNQDGIISEEESLYIAGLDGSEEVSAEDLEVYLQELSNIDINALGDTEEEIITSAENKLPLLDFNDPEVEDKLFDFLGIKIVDGKAVLPDETDAIRRDIYRVYTENPTEGIDRANTYIQEINRIGELANIPGIGKISEYYYGVNIETADLSTISIETLYSIEELAPNIIELNENKAIASAMLGYTCINSTCENKDLEFLNFISNANPDYIYDLDTNSMFGSYPFHFSERLKEQEEIFSSIKENLGITDVEIVYAEDGYTINQVLFTTEDSDEQTSVTFNENGSFLLQTGENEPISSEQLTLQRLNNSGENLGEDITGNTLFAENLSGSYSLDKSFHNVVTYCNGDKETARKIFNGIYAQDGYYIDENFNFNSISETETGEVIYTVVDRGTQNPLYKKDTTVVTDRLFDYHSQDRIVSSSILGQFSEVNMGEVSVNGQNIEVPTSGTQYYVNATGTLCRYEYNISYDPETFVSTNIATIYDDLNNTFLYTEKTITYPAPDGTIRTQIIRKDANNNVIAEFDETNEEYQKRILVERNYASDTDGDGVVNLDISTENIDRMYSTMLQDSRYSGIITEFGAELNSQGKIDQIYNWVLDVFGAENADSITQEIIQRTQMTPAINAFIQGDVEEANKLTQKEYTRRIEDADSLEEVYNITLEYCGNEEQANEIMQAFVEENKEYFLEQNSNYGTKFYDCKFFIDENNKPSVIIVPKDGLEQYEASDIYIYWDGTNEALLEDESYLSIVNSFENSNTEKDFTKELNRANTIEEIYEIAKKYSGDETTALNFVNAYAKYHNDEIYRSNNIYYGEISLDENNSLIFTQNYLDKITLDRLDSSNLPSINTFFANKTQSGIASIGPKDFDSLYSFWTNGGVYNEENIKTYETTSQIYSAYNTSIAGANSFEEALAEAKTPEDVFNIFLEQSNGNEEQAVEAFNAYYSQFLNGENSFEDPSNGKPLDINSTFTHSITKKNSNEFYETINYHPTSITAVQGENGIQIVINLHDSKNKKDTTISCPINGVSSFQYTDTCRILNMVNDKVNDNDMLAQIASNKFESEYRTLFDDPNLPQEDMTYSECTAYMTNMYTDAYTALYGDSDVANLVNSYSENMDSYASTITSFIQMGSIGLSFVCPVFGYVAMGAGFLDNGIDLINMSTNKQHDDFGAWLKNTGFEVGCLAGGMLLGKFANMVGGKVTNHIVKDTHNLKLAHFWGTTAEVGVDVVTGFGFDFITSGCKDWNIGGNAFSGVLDIIAGMRGYSALAASRNQLDLGSAVFGASGSTVTMKNALGEDIELRCYGYDTTTGKLIYGNESGQMLSFGLDAANVDISKFTTNPLLENITSNPLLAQRFFNNGVLFNPATMQYENIHGEKIDLTTKTDNNGNRYIEQIITPKNGGKPYSLITPADYLLQGNTTDCGPTGILNRALMTESGVDKMYGAIRQYDGYVEIDTPDGTIKVDGYNVQTNGLMPLYKQVMPESTHVGGSFADETAAILGLNPVRVEVGENGVFSAENLDALRDMNNDSVLLLGVRNADGTGHYLTIKDIDENGIATVIDPLNPSVEQKIDLTKPSDEFKIEEISGGTSKAIDGELYTPRAENSIPFAGKMDANKIAQTRNEFFSELNKLGIDETTFNSILTRITPNQTVNADNIVTLMIINKVSPEEFATVLKLSGDDTDRALTLTIQKLENYQRLKSNPLFEPFNLSFEEMALIQEGLTNYDISIIENVLLENNPELLMKMTDSEKYALYEGDLNKLIRETAGDLANNSYVHINPEDTVSLKINGQEQVILFPNARDIKPVNIPISAAEDMIKSNLLTMDIINALQQSDIEIQDISHSRVPVGSGNDATTIKLDFSTNEIMQKAINEGFDSLTSHEIHALTDVFSDLYNNDPAFSKLVNGILTDTQNNYDLRMTYAYVQELKGMAEPILRGTNVQINDHVYMRMLDRNLVTVANNQTCHMMSYEEYINMLVSEATKATDSKVYINEHNNGSTIKLLIIPPTGNNTTIVIDSIMAQ